MSRSIYSQVNGTFGAMNMKPAMYTAMMFTTWKALMILFLRIWSFGRKNGLTIRIPERSITTSGMYIILGFIVVKRPLSAIQVRNTTFRPPANVLGRPLKKSWYISESIALYFARRIAAQRT